MFILTHMYTCKYVICSYTYTDPIWSTVSFISAWSGGVGCHWYATLITMKRLRFVDSLPRHSAARCFSKECDSHDSSPLARCVKNTPSSKVKWVIVYPEQGCFPCKQSSNKHSFLDGWWASVQYQSLMNNLTNLMDRGASDKMIILARAV